MGQRESTAGHETRDLSVRAIFAFFVGLVVMGACVLAISTGTLVAFSKQGGITFQYPPNGLANAPAPPEPRLEAVPGQQLKELQSTEEQQLHTYGWVDQNSGIVRIPIERAIELLSQRGLPSRPAAESQFEDSGQQSPSDSSSGREMERFP